MIIAVSTHHSLNHNCFLALVNPRLCLRNMSPRLLCSVWSGTSTNSSGYDQFRATDHQMVCTVEPPCTDSILPVPVRDLISSRNRVQHAVETAPTGHHLAQPSILTPSWSPKTTLRLNHPGSISLELRHLSCHTFPPEPIPRLCPLLLGNAIATHLRSEHCGAILPEVRLLPPRLSPW